MGLLETIAGLLPDFSFEFSFEGGDTVENHVDSTVLLVDNGNRAPIEREDEYDVIDVGNLDETQRDAAKEALTEEWEDVGELFKESTAADKDAIERSIDDDELRETLDYFRPIIPENYVQTLEAALHMRKQQAEMSYVPPGWTRKRRKDIAEKYDGHTYHVINLCSAGYFDEGRYLRKLYERMRERGDYKEGDYARVFGQIVAQRPFTVFVSDSQTASDVKGEIYSKLRSRERHDVDVEFVDVRGIGQDNRDKIKTAVSRMADECGEFQLSERNDWPELVLRIDPETVSLPSQNDD